MLPKITIYTDGACQPNPGAGGWGAVLSYGDESRHVELSGGAEDTTNNRMELTAAIEALKSLADPHRVDIYTDSKYLKKGITQWIPGWRKHNWRTKDKSAVKNQDLWKALFAETCRHTVRWQWLKGHADNRWNEKADALARGAVKKKALPLKDERAIHIFAAVSFQNKTGTGSWCTVLRYKKHVKVLGGTAFHTTGNRMHITAAIEGLSAIKKRLPIHLYTYSGYLKDGASYWIGKWSVRGWKTKENQPVRHRDLWTRLHLLMKKYQIQWHVADKANPPCMMQEAKLMAGEIRNENDSESG